MDTVTSLAHMLGGYAVLLIVPLVYVIVWVARQRRLEKDLEMLEALKHEAPDSKQA